MLKEQYLYCVLSLSKNLWSLHMVSYLENTVLCKNV